MKKSMIAWLLAGCLVVVGRVVCPVQAAAGNLEMTGYSVSTETLGLEESPVLDEDSVSPKAVSYKAGGDCGKDLKWSLDYSGNLEVYGTGNMDYHAGGWKEYRSEIKNIIVGEGCTSISEFRNCENLITVILPSTLQTLEYGVFKNCSSLPSIDLPRGLKVIEDCAFEGCANLTSITLPEGLESLGKGSSGAAFRGCGLKSINIPASVTYLCYYCFAKCQNLTSATINGKDLTICDGAFIDCPNLTTVKMNSGIVGMGGHVFENCISLQNVTLGNNLTGIGNDAFANCTSLKEITIPDKVTKLGGWIGSNGLLGGRCFRECTSLQKVIFGVGVDYIGDDSFKDCTSLKEIYFCGAAPDFSDDTFAGCGEIAGYYPVNSSTWDRSVWTPHGAAQINWNAWIPPINHFSPKLKKIEPTSKGVKLTWEKMSGANGYHIFRKTGNGSWKQVKEIASQSSTSWTDTGLANGKRYTWRICAINGNVQSQVSDSLYQYYLTTIAKNNLKLSSKNGVLTIKWSKNKNASGYKIEYGTKKSFSGAKKRTIKKPKTVKTTMKLTKKKTYYVRIRAYKTVGGKTSYSAWSAIKKIKIK